MDYINDIAKMGACDDALAWLRKAAHPTAEAAWAACPRGDWMLWLAGRCAGPVGDPRRAALALAAADCAELALPYVPAGEDRPRRAIETVRAWARGAATIEEVREARDAAWAAAGAAAWGAEAAARAAEAAAWTAADAAAARAAVLVECADIVRRHYPVPPVLTGA